MENIVINKRNIIFWILVLFFLAYFLTRGLFYSDDGYILNSAYRVVLGQVPYKDFHFAYTPLSIFFDFVSFKLFGVSILASRIMGVIISLITTYVLIQLGKNISKNPALQKIPCFIYLAWLPTHNNFIFPTSLAITFGFITCLVLLKQTNKYFFLSGVTVILTFLSKQNFGVVLFIVSLFALLFFKQTLKRKLFFFYGLATAVITFLLYLILTHSLTPFVSDLNTYTFQRIVNQGTLSTSFFYGKNFYALLKTLLYLSPVIISVWAFILDFKKNKIFLFLHLFLLSYFLIGIRPTTDYIHLVPLLSLLGISMVRIIEEAKVNIKLLFIFISAIFVCLGFYTGVFRQYYRWNPRLWENNLFLSHSPTYVYAFDNEILTIANCIDKKTSGNDFIFVNYYSPLFYFVSQRENATKFDLIENTKFYEDNKKEIIQDLQSKNVHLVITKKNGGGYLSDYIRRNYKNVSDGCPVGVWER